MSKLLYVNMELLKILVSGTVSSIQPFYCNYTFKRHTLFSVVENLFLIFKLQTTILLQIMHIFHITQIPDSHTCDILFLEIIPFYFDPSCNATAIMW